jgi:hypothetical protein
MPVHLHGNIRFCFTELPEYVGGGLRLSHAVLCNKDGSCDAPAGVSWTTTEHPEDLKQVHLGMTHRDFMVACGYSAELFDGR